MATPVALTIQTVTIAGTAIATVPASATGNTFINTGNVAIRINNGGAAAIDMTLVARRPCNQGVLHNQVISVPPGESRDVFPVPANQFNDDNGLTTLTYSAVTNVTVAAVRYLS